MYPPWLFIIVMLLLIAGISTSPIATAEQQPITNNMQPTTLDERELMLGPGISKPDYNCMSMGEMVSMIAGAIVGGAAADFALRSAPFAVVGIAAGAAVGSLLYRYSP